MSRHPPHPRPPGPAVPTNGDTTPAFWSGWWRTKSTSTNPRPKWQKLCDGLAYGPTLDRLLAILAELRLQGGDSIVIRANVHPDSLENAGNTGGHNPVGLRQRNR